MKCHVNFKHLDYSHALVEYAQERLQRLEKYEWKPVHVRLTLSRQKHLIRAELTAATADASFQSSVKTQDFYAAVDQVVDKLGRQLARKKGKLQHHKNRLNDHHAKLTHIIPFPEPEAAETEQGDLAKAS